jgi:hypothetical protein
VVDLAQDSARLARLRTAARASSQGCDWQTIVGQVEAVMQQAASCRIAENA